MSRKKRIRLESLVVLVLIIFHYFCPVGWFWVSGIIVIISYVDLEILNQRTIKENLDCEVQIKRIIRHTHSTTAGIEDALAACIDILNECEQSQAFIEGRSHQLHQILMQVREGPNAYDKNKPAGAKPTKTRRLVI